MTQRLSIAWHHFKQGHFEEVERTCGEVLRADAQLVEARHLRGMAMFRLGRFAEAEADLQEVVVAWPDSIDAHSFLGMARALQGRVDEAIVPFRRVLELDPNRGDAHNNLGRALRDLGRLEEAEASFREALRLEPGHAMALASLTRLLAGRGKHEELADILRQVVRVRPDDPQDRMRLGEVLLRLEWLDEAVASLEAAVALAPDGPGPRIVLGSALTLLGRFEEALDCYEQAVRLAPDQAPAHVNRSLVWLLRGDYARGWPEYDWRLEGKAYSPCRRHRPRWRGEPPGGRTILLAAEQGLGDTLQFIRYAPLVKRAGARVLLECQRSLVRLAETCAGIDGVIPVGEPLPDFDLHVPLLSLPGAFKTTVETVPASIPYLGAEPALVAHWGERLGLVEGLRVGIVWQGDPRHPRDRSRSFPLRSFEGLARIDGVRLISLQRGPGVEQLRAPGDRFPLIDLGDLVDPGLKAMRDTPAIMRNLDLVITPDSAPAHLAGALGVPVWIPLSFIPDFRWLLDRDDSPWYPTARLFRRSRHGGWDEVFGRMAEALAAMVATR